MGGVEYVAQLFSECNPGSTSKLCDSTPAVAWKIVRELSVVMALRAGLTGKLASERTFALEGVLTVVSYLQ